MQAAKKSAMNRCTFRCLEIKLNILRGEMNKMYHGINVETRAAKKANTGLKIVDSVHSSAGSYRCNGLHVHL